MLPPVQTLVASSILPNGQNANESPAGHRCEAANQRVTAAKQQTSGLPQSGSLLHFPYCLFSGASSLREEIDSFWLTFSPSVGILVVEEDFPFRAPPLAEEPVTVGNLLFSQQTSVDLLEPATSIRANKSPLAHINDCFAYHLSTQLVGGGALDAPSVALWCIFAGRRGGAMRPPPGAGKGS